MSNLSSSAARVQKALNDKGVDLKVVELTDSTRTADDAAQAVGCHVGQIAKSLIFRLKKSDVPLLVVTSGQNRVDTKKVAKLVGEKLGRADADYVREHTGYAIGGIPPLGHLNPIRTIMDQDLLEFDRIWAAAGTPHALFELTPEILKEITGADIQDVRQ